MMMSLTPSTEIKAINNAPTKVAKISTGIALRNDCHRKKEMTARIGARNFRDMKE